MKVFVVLTVLVAIAAAAPTSEEILQAFDFDSLLKNEEMRPKAFDCLLDKVDCGDLQPIKDAIILVLKNKCADCNAEQKTRYDHVLKQVQEKFGSFYTELQKKIGN